MRSRNPQPEPQPTRRWDRRARERGQALIMYVGAVVFFVGFMAIVVDVTWYWMNTLKVQRAADAAALAGAVKLPDFPSQAQTLAYNEAEKNGYKTGVAGATVTAAQDPTRDIQLDTSVTAPVNTFFMHLFGIDTITASRRAAAEYVLPVPMGSPLNYFGAFGALRGWIHMDSGWRYATATRAGQGVPDTWVTPNYAYLDETPNPALYTTTGNATDYQGFRTFRLPGSTQPNLGMPASSANARFQADGGVEVVVKARSSVNGCRLQAEVSSNSGSGAGATWTGATSPFAIGDPATLTTTDTEYTFGGHQSTGASDSGDWFGRTSWSSTNFSDGNFAVRLRAVGGGSCGTATTYVDFIKVRVTYEQQSPLITGPNGEPLNQQGVWATVNSQGSQVINGDAYSSQYNGGTAANTQYSPGVYYDYAVEMQPGTSDGTVYVFDPVFCATNSNGSQGMGDRWYGGSAGMSTFYDIYDTNSTPYDLTDDPWIAGNSGPQGGSNPLNGLFKKSQGTDPSQGGPAVSGSMYNCQYGKVTNPAQGGYWHNRWWPLATNLAGPTGAAPRVYRIRVTSTDLGAASDQSPTNGQNSFSFFGAVTGHTCPTTPFDPQCPRVYGLGAMQAFSPLSPAAAADLYLAQIGAAYAGKTMKVTLWDPGDTGSLTANLSFLMPTSSGYTTAPMTWTATRFASGGANCNGSSPGTVTSITTSNGGASGLFNGCWVVINIAVPTTYSAPTPPGEPGGGWWKIRYTMGAGSSAAFDVTTWKTQMIGNPVHLVTP